MIKKDIIAVKKDDNTVDINIGSKKCQYFINSDTCRCLKVLEEVGVRCLVAKSICEKCNDDFLHSFKIRNLESYITLGHCDDEIIIEKLKQLEQLKGSRDGIKETFLKMAKNGIYLNEEIINLAQEMGLED